MMLVCIKTSIKASGVEDKPASESEAANCCGLSGRKNNRYVRCSNGDYPRQNGLAVALRELGHIERTLFILGWLQSVELRRRVHAGLNKGETRNALARAVFFNRLGEIRDRSFEQQRYRARDLNVVTAAIVLWNTVYLGSPQKTEKSYAKASRKRRSARSLAEKMARRSVDVAGEFSKTVLGSNGLERRVSRTLDGRQRQEQGKRRVWQDNEAGMPVKSGCRFVVGVHHQGESGNLRTGGPVERISQKRTAKTLPLECLIDSQAAHPNGGHARIARQLLAGASRKIGQQQAC